MRMQLVEPVPPFFVTCCECRKRLASDAEAVYADLDGPAFRAYYCGGCAVKRTEGFTKGMVEPERGSGI